ncbi:adenylyl-sulfate kinase [Candidatus Pseudothioglobus singularis]|nr:adenylyl-sulfate kinase [Candidatus Pseudothioglobus singularis]
MVVWISGVTASGKTTLGVSLKEDIINFGYNQVVHLDGDVLRKRTGWIKGHSLSDRFEVLKLLVDLVLEEESNDNIVIVSTVSHKQAMRDYARKKIIDFHEVCLKCDPEICENRDYKGFYKRARHSSKTDKSCYPGVSEEYEVNENAELILNTGDKDIDVTKKLLTAYVFEQLKK